MENFFYELAQMKLPPRARQDLSSCGTGNCQRPAGLLNNTRIIGRTKNRKRYSFTMTFTPQNRSTSHSGRTMALGPTHPLTEMSTKG
jgi:hypothetical protein